MRSDRATDQPTPLLAPDRSPEHHSPDITPDRADDIAYYVDLAERHEAAGRWKDAEVAYTEAIRLAPSNTSVLLARALLYKKSGLNQNTLDDLAAAIRIDPNLTEAAFARGTLYVQLKDFDRAVEDLDAVLRQDPSCAEAVAYRGWARHGLGDDLSAEQDLYSAITIDPDCGVAYQFRGLWHKGRKEYVRAVSDFESAIRCMPESPYCYTALASLLAACPDRAVRDGQRAKELATTGCALTNWADWRAIRVLASAYAETGSLDDAIHWGEKALELTPPMSQREVRAQLDGYRKRADASPELSQ